MSKITTRTGDDGKTGLSGGSRVDKDTPRIEAIGTVDELSSFIGFGQSLIPEQADCEGLRKVLRLVQHDLFDLGGLSPVRVRNCCRRPMWTVSMLLSKI